MEGNREVAVKSGNREAGAERRSAFRGGRGQRKGAIQDSDRIALVPSRLRKNSFGVSFRGVPQARDDEESRIVLKTLRARFLSRACGIGMTAWKGFSHLARTIFLKAGS